MKRRDFEAIVFDMDGVIFDSERLVRKCWKVIADKYNIPDIENTNKACMGLSREAIIRVYKDKYGEDFPYEEYKAETRILFGQEKLPVMKGVRELFEAIHENGVKMALATSTRAEVVREELMEAALYDCFDAIITGDMVTNGKPAPDIYLLACERIGVRPEAAYGIEDSYNGVRSIKAANMRAIMVPDMAEATEEMYSVCETVLPTLIDVKDYLFE